ncbi:plastocyanin [Leptolyngbya valderiana BDU 20041]|nr:plastocyanin [Leptolyngbya valderiana BDU 20041]
MRLANLNFKPVVRVLLAAVIVLSSFAIAVAPASAETYTVKMGADNGMLAFQPKTLKVSPGDTVKWEINKLPPHNVVFDTSSAPDSGLAQKLSHDKLAYAPGDGYEETIPEDAKPGTYSYYCTPHRGAGMVGELIIE